MIKNKDKKESVMPGFPKNGNYKEKGESSDNFENCYENLSNLAVCSAQGE